MHLTQRKCISRCTQNNSAYAEQCESSLYFPSIEKYNKKVRKMCMRWTFISNFNSNVALCTWVRDITIDIKPNCFYEWRSLVPYKIRQKFMYSFLLLTHSNMPFRTYCNPKGMNFRNSFKTKNATIYYAHNNMIIVS